MAGSSSAAERIAKAEMGSSSGSVRTALRASLELVSTALSTLASSSAARRSPEPSKRSSKDLGQVDDRPGINGEAALASRGSQNVLPPSGDVGWKVSPLRRDIVWKESINEGVTDESTSRAGRRRGLMAVVDMIEAGDRV